MDGTPKDESGDVKIVRTLRVYELRWWEKTLFHCLYRAFRLRSAWEYLYARQRDRDSRCACKVQPICPVHGKSRYWKHSA